jgi:hypothetical protein
MPSSGSCLHQGPPSNEPGREFPAATNRFRQVAKATLSVHFGQTAGGLDILDYWRDLRFQRVSAHPFKFRHRSDVFLDDMPTAGGTWRVSAPDPLQSRGIGCARAQESFHRFLLAGSHACVRFVLSCQSPHQKPVAAAATTNRSRSRTVPKVWRRVPREADAGLAKARIRRSRSRKLRPR